jgi:hypothetical protein
MPTLGSKVSNKPSTKRQCLYTGVLPSTCDPGTAKEYGLPGGGGGRISAILSIEADCKRTILAACVCFTVIGAEGVG